MRKLLTTIVYVTLVASPGKTSKYSLFLLKSICSKHSKIDEMFLHLFYLAHQYFPTTITYPLKAPCMSSPKQRGKTEKKRK